MAGNTPGPVPMSKRERVLLIRFAESLGLSLPECIARLAVPIKHAGNGLGPYRTGTPPILPFRGRGPTAS